MPTFSDTRNLSDKEKLLEKKYWEILDEIAIKYYKGYEHGKVKSVTGKEVDKLLKNSESYVKRLKELVKEIEKQAGEKTILQIHEDTFNILKSILGKGAEKAKANFNMAFYPIPSDLVFETPNYKVWVGNFRSRLEADRSLVKVQKEFQNAFVFKPKKEKDQ